MAETYDASPPALHTTGAIHTFLIADVRGYTAYTLEHGDEAAARLASRFADIVDEVVSVRDGRVLELRGDEALVVFDSARLALRAAVDLQTRLQAEIERDPSLPLRVGVGLDAGEAIPVRDGFRGAALNMAARLCSLAGPGEVLASDGVMHLARKVEGVAYIERGMVQLKGFADPVRVIRVELGSGSPGGPTEVTGLQTGPAANANVPPRQDLPFGGFLGALPVTPLVARERDLAQVLGAVDGVAGGTGRLVLISGEPGVGKTRLAQEVTLEVRNRGFAIAAGRCYEAHQNIAFYPFVEALTAVYGAAPASIQADISRQWPDLARLLPSLGLPPPETTSNADQQRLFWAVTGLLQALAAIQPVALMLDDLHWTDAASLELLQHLARHTRRSAVLLLGTFRDVEVNRQHPLEAALRDLHREGLVERLDLNRLERTGTSELMAASMGEEEISNEFAELVYQRTEGNPFFVQQVMRVLVERGDIFRRDGRWDRKTIEEIDVPESIRSVVGQRLSRLSAETQEVLYDASVLGQTFQFDDLEGMTARSERELEGALAEAARGGLVRETGRDVYSFDHALTQQSLYGELTTRRRRRLHLAAGEALEALSARRQEGRAAELAWHFLEGDDPARALSWSVEAGDAAMGVFAYSDAEMHFRTARELADELDDTVREAAALEKLGGAVLSLSRFDEGIEVLETATRLYRDLQNTEGEMRVAAQIGKAHSERGTRQEGITRLAPLLEQVPATPSPPLADLQVELARLYFFEGRYDEALALADRATALARELRDDRLLGRAQTRRASSLAFLDRYDEAIEGYREAISLAERTGDLYTLMMALNNLWVEQMRRSQIVEADVTLGRQVEVVRRMGEPAAIAFSLYQVGNLERARGRFSKALAAFEEAAAISASIGPNRSGSASAEVGNLRLLMEHDGGLQELEAIADSSESLPRIYARAYLALWDILHNRPDAALDRVHPVVDAPELESQSRWLVDTRVGLALAQLGEIERAEQMAIAGIGEGRTLQVGENYWRHTLIEVRIAQGRTADARALVAENLSTQRQAGVTFEEALTLFLFGSALLRHGEHELAREPLQEALHLFRRMNSPPLIRRTDELLQAPHV